MTHLETPNTQCRRVQQETSLKLWKEEQSILLTVQSFWPRCSSTHWYLFSLTVLRGSTSAANRRLSSAYSWPERQPENNYTHTHRGIGNIPIHPWKRPWCVFLHKSGYHATYQITKTEKGFLPGHNRVSSLREETVSSDDSMVVALPSNILPENKRSLLTEATLTKSFQKVLWVTCLWEITFWKTTQQCSVWKLCTD